MPTPARATAPLLALAALLAACALQKKDVASDGRPDPRETEAGPVADAGSETVPYGEEGIDPYADQANQKAPAAAQPHAGTAHADRATRATKGAPKEKARSRTLPARPAPEPGQAAGLSRREADGGYGAHRTQGADPYALPPSGSLPSPEAASPSLPRTALSEDVRQSSAAPGSAASRHEGQIDRHCLALECRPLPPPPPNRHIPPGYSGGEEYAPIHENAFRDARAEPLSTFSIDVDGASYANVRRFLREGSLPPADAVRTEELVNSFTYGHAGPRGSDPFAIHAEAAVTPWNPETRLVLIGLQGRRVEERKLPPSNLVFLVDVSGSMDTPDKLPLLKDAFDVLVDRLRPQDRISLVVYAGAAGMVLPPTRGDDKEAIRDALARLSAGGSTAGGAGLMLAYQAAREAFIPGGNNRVILATDGDFNVGISSEDELARFIAGKRKSGIQLSVLGFGTGNYKDARMEALAKEGDGNYYYIDGIHEARRVLGERMAGTLHAIARDVKLQVEFNPAAVRSYRLIGYENRVLAAEDFNDDRKDAGELGAGHTVTALYEILPAAPPRPAVDPLNYQDGGDAPYASPRRRWGFGASRSDELLTVKFRYKRPGASESRLLSRVVRASDRPWREASEAFRLASAAAGFGLLLRDSRYRGDLDYGLVLALARSARGRDPGGERSEFLHLVTTAQLLSGTEPYGYRER